MCFSTNTSMATSTGLEALGIENHCQEKQRKIYPAKYEGKRPSTTKLRDIATSSCRSADEGILRDTTPHVARLTVTCIAFVANIFVSHQPLLNKKYYHVALHLFVLEKNPRKASAIFWMEQSLWGWGTKRAMHVTPHLYCVPMFPEGPTGQGAIHCEHKHHWVRQPSPMTFLAWSNEVNPTHIGCMNTEFDAYLLWATLVIRLPLMSWRGRTTVRVGQKFIGLVTLRPWQCLSIPIIPMHNLKRD